MEDHIVLYRQYRPLKFDDVVGQEAAVTALRQSVVAKKLAHAYLFCGQHGTGKTTIAKIFARAVNCENPVNGNPCNECPTCKGILDGSILDVTEMDAASNNGVDDIRPILQEVNFAPTRTTYKVYIIDEVHMLSKGAFNALLKTIEEPPKHVMFLFATTESDKIPATIISRCQRYDFKRIPIDLISGRLREVCGKSGIKASDDALRLIASRSDGALRDALSLLDQISAISGGDNEISSQDVERITGTVDSSFLFKMANCLIDARFDELIDLCEILNGSGKNQARFTLDLAAYFRDLLIIRVKADPIIYLPYPKETIQDMYQTAAKVSADTLTGYISYLSKEYAELRKSPDIPTSFELMLMRLCGRKSALPVTPIVIPDFEKNQAAKAATLTLNDSRNEDVVKETVEVKSSDKPGKAEEVEKAEEPEKPVITKTPKDVKSLFKKKTEEIAKTEETSEAKSEEKPEDSAEVSDPAVSEEPSIPVPPAPYRPQPSATPYRPQPSAAPSLLFSFGSSSSEIKTHEEPKPASGSLFSSIIREPEAAAPAEPEEPAEPEDDESQDDEYIPADTSYEKHAEPTIFSFMPKEEENTESKFNFGFDEPEEKEEPAPMQPLGIFAGLSSSFLNDLENEKSGEEAEPEEPAPVQPRSQIAVQADKSGLIVDGRTRDSVRAPSFTDEDADIAVRWTNVTSNLKGTNENIAVILERTSLKKEGTSAYIVFEDRDITLLSNLKKSQAFRQISSGIKDEFGAEHLYICTHKQYTEQVKREQASELDKKLDDLNERSKNMGVPTDVHFGD